MNQDVLTTETNRRQLQQSLHICKQLQAPVDLAPEPFVALELEQSRFVDFSCKTGCLDTEPVGARTANPVPTTLKFRRVASSSDSRQMLKNLRR